MSVDITKIKPGDEVTVRLRVIRYGPNDYRGLSYVVCEDGYGEHLSGPQDVVVLADRIVSHTPKALEPGDRVTIPHRGEWVGRPKHIEATILSVSDGWAWLRDGEGDHITTKLEHLERVDA